MDDGLKQRLIGAIVLLAIAVIVIPTLIDRQTITPVDRVTQVPPMPKIEIEPIKVAEPPVVESPAPEPEAMFIPDDTQPESEEPESPSLNDNGVPRGWMLQVVSYDEEVKAASFRDKLVGDGYPASFRRTETSKGVRYRVYVGPKLDKSRLLDDKKAIEQRYKLKAIMLDMTPKN